LLLNFVAKIWNGLASPLRREVAWLLHAKFTHGVAGVILDPQGRVLLLKHRFWKRQQWGLPGGHARRRETLAATLRRELREETGLEIRPVKLLRVSTMRPRQAEFFVQAECSGEPNATSYEILEARFCEPTALPENLLPAHREVLEQLFAQREWPGLELE